MSKITIQSGTTKQFLKDINSNFDELYNKVKNITSGTEEPNDSEGEDGDIYIQYDE